MFLLFLLKWQSVGEGIEEWENMRERGDDSATMSRKRKVKSRNTNNNEQSLCLWVTKSSVRDWLRRD